MDLKHGAWVATAVAAMLSAGCGSDKENTSSAAQEVKCEGANECKGLGECASKDADSAHGCQGLNECKGQGWITVPSADECAKKGGRVIS